MVLSTKLGDPESYKRRFVVHIFSLISHFFDLPNDRQPRKLDNFSFFFSPNRDHSTCDEPVRYSHCLNGVLIRKIAINGR